MGNDINKENSLILEHQMNEKKIIKQELISMKETLNETECKLNDKNDALQIAERHLNEMNETMDKIKKDTKRSDELLSDRTVEVQAVQFQLDKAREHNLKLNITSLQKQNKIDSLDINIKQKENKLIIQNKKLQQILGEIEKNTNELGQIEGRIQLKNLELSSI